MRNYWFRILAGAVGVFVAGMIVFSIGRGIAQETKEAVVAAVEESKHESRLDFVLDGRNVAKVENLMVARTSRSIDSLSFSVRLPEEVPVPEGACFLLNVTPSDEDDPALRCSTTAQESDIATVGHVTFQPSGEVRALQVPLDMAKRMWRRERGTLTNYFGSATTDVLSDAFVKIRTDSNGSVVQVRDGSQSFVKIVTDSNGAGSIVITDASGRKVVDISGDHEGGRIVIDADKAGELGRVRGELGRQMGEIGRQLGRARTDEERRELQAAMRELAREMAKLEMVRVSANVQAPDPPEPPAPPKR